MKIAIVTCYDQNDYVRARTLRTAFAAVPGAQTRVVRNGHKGILRYIEVPLKILRARFLYRPDAYVITFRGYEMLLYMALTFVRKPIIFDEMINFTEWMDEHGVLRSGTPQYKLFRWWYGWLAGRAKFILADTDAHAAYSSALNKIDSGRYTVVPVGTDESVFYPRSIEKPKDSFTVFYYGHMRPLHGLQYVLDAAVRLKDNPKIIFRFVGGKEMVAQACQAAAEQGAHVTHEKWLPFEDLPQAALEAGLTLGGPFGDTLQSRYVVTGKTYQFLALGAPVLIGKNLINEGFSDRQNCLVVPQAGSKAIAEAISWAYEHPYELKAIGQAGRKLYEQHFSQTVINGLIASVASKLEN